MSAGADGGDADGYDYDVAVVGGGPAGCSAGVFCARDRLDTVIFDCGTSSIKRCAYLENYLGFPGGIDIETFYELMHEHARTAGCSFVAEHVGSVLQREDGEGFLLRTQDERAVTARRVVAATRYDGEYLRPLEDDAMFETVEYDGETREQFDRSYPEADGATPIEGLYVASPADEADTQAIMAAGRGARVAHRVIADARVDDGWWAEIAEDRVDWVRQKAERGDKWDDRETWVEWFDGAYGEDAPVDVDSERFREVREAYIDERLAGYVTDEEIEARAEAGHETLAEHVDTEALVEAVDDEALLDAIDDETIREYVDDERPESTIQ